MPFIAISYGPFLTKKKITIRDIFVANRVFFLLTIDDKDHDSHMIFSSFPPPQKVAIRDIPSRLDMCLIKALRNPRGTNGIRRPLQGHGRLPRMPIVASEQLPKETAGRGLTSTLRPRNLEEETQREEGAKIF